MRKFYVLLGLLFSTLLVSAQVTVSWNFGTASANPLPSTGFPVGHLSISNLTSGNNNGTTTLLTTTSASSGYTGASGSYNAGAAARIGELNTSESGSAYFEITLTPESGYTFNLTDISFGSRSTSTGPQAYSIRTSLDGFATDQTSGALANDSKWAMHSNTISLSGSDAVTLRIYGYNGGGSPGANTANWRIDDLSLTLTMSGGNGSTSTTISLSPDANAAEPATTGRFLINFSAPTTTATTLSFSYNGSAIFGNDYIVSYTNASTASASSSGVLSISAGTSSVTISITPKDDALMEGNETVQLTLSNPANGFLLGTSEAGIQLLDNEIPHVVINQVYGGGGNSGADYKNDFIELYNNEDIPVSLAGWSVQYSSATGSGSWNGITPLTGIVPAHGFYLIREAQGNNGTTDLPTPDEIGSIPMGASGGKVVLSSSTAQLSGANPSGLTIIDKVGYGSNATGYETAPADGPPDNKLSIKRIIDGEDHDNNSTDFALASPEPRNSTFTTAPPVVVEINPIDNGTEIPYNYAPTTIVFNKTVKKGNGTVTVYENNQVVSTLSVNDPGITITNGKTVTLPITYQPGKSYAITVSSGAFADAYGNAFAGFTTVSDWNFTTYNATQAVTLPATFDFQNCTGTSLLPNGFSQFSETGSVVWNCTPFGRDPQDPAGTASTRNAIQINGYDGTTNIANVDWLISPALDLTGTAYPLLSFWSRTAFNGLPLQLKVSTDYPGTGDPRNYTWTDLNGRFPDQTSNIWTESSNINLSAFKSSNVHIAFVYTSSDDDGARWTVDDFSVVNSATPPPPSLTVATNELPFGFVAKGATGDKTFTFIGNDLTEAVTLSATGAFLLSKDGVSFTPSISYAKDEANNLAETVYVRFSPTQADQNYTGGITVSTTNQRETVSLSGTSLDPASTLEVVNWNMEWFGSPTLGPSNDNQQEENAQAILKSIGADIFGLVEVVDEARLARVVTNMPGYSYVIGQYGSHVNPPDPNGGPLGDAQKLAFVYKTDLFSNITTRPLINNQNTSSTSYNNWSSGRYPFLFTADLMLNGTTQKVNFVLVHAKANTSPTTTSYNRRKAAANELHDTLMQYFANEKVIVLGDFNDDLDQSITAGFTTTSYSSFTEDASNFFSPTLALSLAGKKSTVSYNDMIDHVVITNDMQPLYLPGSATVLSNVATLVSNYGATTTDHYPVFTRYMFCKLTCPQDITVANETGKCGAVVTFSVGSSMTCGTVTAVPASGTFFPIGITKVEVSSTTGETCSFNVEVKDEQKPTITCGEDLVVNPVSLDGAPVSFATPTATDNCETPAVVQTAGLPSGSVFPIGTTTNTFEATDAAGNKTTCSFTVKVRDPYCDNNENSRKVFVCFNGKTNCVSVNALQTFLNKGAHLGQCDWYSGSTAFSTKAAADQADGLKGLSFSTYPNPVAKTTQLQFTLPVSARVVVKVFDLMGREVNTVFSGNRSAGTYQISYNTTTLKPGVYYCRMVATANGKEYVQMQKLVKL